MKLEFLLFKFQAAVQPTGLPDASFEATLASVLKIVFMIAALLAVVFVTVGGLKYTLSNGDPQGIAKAKNTIVSAVVGLIIAISAFTIISFLAGRL